MMKRGSLLLVALLLSLPGCMEKKEKKAAQPKKNKKITQQMASSDRAMDETQLTDADMESFFNELGEFDLADAQEGLRKDEFAWADDEDLASALEAVHFAFNSADINSEEESRVRSTADKAKQLLTEAQTDGFDAKLIVEGYACTSAGTEEYNQLLSAQRAERVKQVLVESGIRAEDIETRGSGTANPIVTGGSRDEQQPNRRVELHVVYS